MIRRILRRFLDSSLRTKYLAAILLLVGAMFLGSSYLISRNLQSASDTLFRDAQSDMTDIYREINRFEKRMVHLSTIMQNSEVALNLLSSIPDLDLQSFEPVRQKINPILYSMLDGSGDYDCRLYIPASNDFMDSTYRVLLLPDPEKEPWVQNVMSGWGWRQFYFPRELGADAPAFLAPIRDPDHVQNLIGLLRIDMAPSALQHMITPVRSSGFVSCYLESPEGDIITSGGFPLTDPDYLDALTPAERTGFQASMLHTMDMQDKTVLYQQLSTSGWMLAMVFHRDILTRQLLGNQLSSILVGLFLILAGFLCALPILWHAVKRIQRFHSYVKQYNESNLSEIPPRLEPLAHDEIGALIDAHNAMLDHIQLLMREKSRQEEELRRLEIFALQAQIKPHFLYNTLEAIGWMSRLHMPEKVDSTIQSLTAFYRLCLSSGKDILTVEKELDIIRNYFAVACMRYEGQYTLDIQVEDEALGMTLPKLTLQPLVENALMHGLLESGQPNGIIRLFTRKNAGGEIELCIADSGAHFSQQAWKRILLNPESYGSDGYGLKNVERRLCLYYGQPKVMHLDLSDPQWSVVVIPLSHARQADE